METVNVIVQFIKFLIKFFEWSSIYVSKFTNNDRVQNSQIPQRLQNCFRIKKFWGLYGVRFNASHKMAIARIKLLN
jgi:hypothetical protein